MVRWLSSPEASIAASCSSWRSGRMMRPDSIQAMVEAMVIAASPNRRLRLNRAVMPAEATSVGRPTLTNQGARCVVE